MLEQLLNREEGAVGINVGAVSRPRQQEAAKPARRRFTNSAKTGASSRTRRYWDTVLSAEQALHTSISYYTYGLAYMTLHSCYVLKDKRARHVKLTNNRACPWGEGGPNHVTGWTADRMAPQGLVTSIF